MKNENFSQNAEEKAKEIKLRKRRRRACLGSTIYV